MRSVCVTGIQCPVDPVSLPVNMWPLRRNKLFNLIIRLLDERVALQHTYQVPCDTGTGKGHDQVEAGGSGTHSEFPENF